MASHGGDILYLCSFLCYVLLLMYLYRCGRKNENGRENTSVSGRRVLDHQNSQQQDKATMGEPSTHLIHLWTAAIQSGHRAMRHDAIYFISLVAARGAGVVSGSGAE